MSNCLGDTHDILVCDCCCIEHCIVIRQFEGDSNLYFEIHLSNCLPLYKRLWVAIKYIFGYKCKYGSFDEIIIDKISAAKLRNICDNYLKSTRE